MRQIKNIIVATDFSATARNAYRYAKKLADILDATLTTVYIKEHFIMVSDVMFAQVPHQDDAILIKNIEQIIAEEAAEDKEKNEVKIEILKGEPISVLTELSLNNDVDLIIIGTTGLNNLLTKIVGTTSLNVANKAHCPVILVPHDAKWSPIEQILYASNYDSITPKAIQEISGFALRIKADIHFVNVKNFDPVFEIKQHEIDWNKLFKSVDSDLSFETHTIYGNDTVAELIKYSEIQNINMIAFSSDHRNFLENIIHQSVTENLALSTTIPMMIIHSDDKQ